MNNRNTASQFNTDNDENIAGSYIYGRNAVVESLNAGHPLEKIYIAYGTEGVSIDEIRRLAKTKGVRVAQTDRRKFADLELRIAANRGIAQGVIALERIVDTIDVHELIDAAYQITDTPILVALDGINDPHNIGAIARAAECAGAHGLILSIEKSSPISPIAFKASAGALAYLPTAKAGTLEPALKDCKAAGFRLIGADSESSKKYSEIDTEVPIVLVIGSEGTGMTPSVRRLCDERVKIPMYGKIPSLNASVAAGIILFSIAEKNNDNLKDS